MNIERVAPSGSSGLNPSVFVNPLVASVLPKLSAANRRTSFFLIEEPREVTFDTVLPAVPTLTASEMAIGLRDAGLPVSAIAEAVGVERKTIYSWFGGEACARESHQWRLAQIFRLLLPYGRSNLSDLYRMWNTPFEGTTLKSLLASRTLDVGTVAKAVEALREKAVIVAEAKRRMRADGANGLVEGIETTTNP